MFTTVDMAPPDPIIGLTEAFKRDANPEKINLSVGVYKDAEGNTPVLKTVKEAERRILDAESSKSYPPLDGVPEFGIEVQKLIFGADHETLARKRIAVSQAVGGTGALRIAAEYLAKTHPGKSIWFSDPTWQNHWAVFGASGVEASSYPYFDAATNAIAMDELLKGLEKIPQGDVVLLHGCCHNPTGIDPTVDQWKQIGDALADRELLPLVDFAYQGFGTDLKEDAAGVVELCRPGGEMIICSSYSKNFGIYNERVGAITLVADTQPTVEKVMSHIKKCSRATYSFPPTHGAKIVATVLSDAQLRSRWEGEVEKMRGRINDTRKLFVQTLAAKGVNRDFSFITEQKGMFSFSGLNKDQVQVLRERYSIYIVGSGRINVAGMTEDNMERLCHAIADVLE